MQLKRPVLVRQVIYLFLSEDLCHVRYNYQFFSFIFSAQRNVGGSCSKDIFSRRNAASVVKVLATYTFSTPIFQA